MKLRPLDDRVTIEPAVKEEVTKSGLVIPDSAKERPEQGTIISVGPGKLNEEGKRTPLDLKKGDKVLFTRYGPNEIKIDNKEYLIARADDILAILEK